MMVFFWITVSCIFRPCYKGKTYASKTN